MINYIFHLRKHMPSFSPWLSWCCGYDIYESICMLLPYFLLSKIIIHGWKGLNDLIIWYWSTVPFRKITSSPPNCQVGTEDTSVPLPAPVGWGSMCHYDEQIHHGDMGKTEYIVKKWERRRNGAVHVPWTEVELELQ